MPTRLVVDGASQLRELTDPPPNRAVVIVARIISYVFHPIFVPLYILLFLLYEHPTVFAGFSAWEKTRVLLPGVGMYILFPVVTVLLLKALNFIDSIYLRTQRDRIIPYIACNLWYFWVWYVWKNLPDLMPHELVVLSLGIFLASVIGMMANIYLKISMHTIAMGVLVAFMVMLGLKESVSFGIYTSVSFLIAGIVCSARMLLSDHTQKEVYLGLLAGMGGILIALLFS